MKQVILSILSLLLVLNSAFAGGQKEGEQKKEMPVIRYAYQWTGAYDDQMQEYAESVKDKYILELESAPGLDHKQKIQVEAAGGNLPDVFQYWSYETNIKDFAENEIVLNVEDFLNNTDKVTKNDFNEATWFATKVNDKNFGFPVSSFKGFFLVNKSIFETYNIEPPKTWDDLKNISKVLRKNGIIPFSMASLKGNPGHLFFSSLTYQSKDGYDETTKLSETNNFDTNAVRRAAEAIEKLIEWNTIPGDTITNGGWGPQTALYNSEKAAMIYTFPWKIGDIEPSIVEKSIIIPVPSIPGAEVDPADFTVGGISISLYINKTSFEDPAKQSAIIELMEHLLSDKVYTEVATNGKGFPAKQITLPKGNIKLFDMVQDFTSDQNIYGLHEFFFPSLESFDIYKSACDELYAGSLGADEFIQRVQSGLGK